MSADDDRDWRSHGREDGKSSWRLYHAVHREQGIPYFRARHAAHKQSRANRERLMQALWRWMRTIMSRVWRWWRNWNSRSRRRRGRPMIGGKYEVKSCILHQAFLRFCWPVGGPLNHPVCDIRDPDSDLVNSTFRLASHLETIGFYEPILQSLGVETRKGCIVRSRNSNVGPFTSFDRKPSPACNSIFSS